MIWVVAIGGIASPCDSKQLSDFCMAVFSHNDVSHKATPVSRYLFNKPCNSRNWATMPSDRLYSSGAL
jgi:hypothetical protein